MTDMRHLTVRYLVTNPKKRNMVQNLNHNGHWTMVVTVTMSSWSAGQELICGGKWNCVVSEYMLSVWEIFSAFQEMLYKWSYQDPISQMIFQRININCNSFAVYSTNLRLIVNVDNMGPSCPKSISINVQDIANARNSATKMYYMYFNQIILFSMICTFKLEGNLAVLWMPTYM